MQPESFAQTDSECTLVHSFVNLPTSSQAALLFSGELQHFTEQTAAECFVLGPCLPKTAAPPRAETKYHNLPCVRTLQKTAAGERDLPWSLAFDLHLASVKPAMTESLFPCGHPVFPIIFPPAQRVPDARCGTEVPLCGSVGCRVGSPSVTLFFFCAVCQLSLESGAAHHPRCNLPQG